MARPAPPRPDPLALMADEVRQGLSRRPLPELPSKYLYDGRGSALFEQITRLPEYYQTRTETALLEAHAASLVREQGPRELIELGAGTSPKLRLFLEAMRGQGTLESVVLVDMAESALSDSVRRLERDYPEARVFGLAADFLRDLRLLGRRPGRLLLLLAGTVGNLSPDDLPGFLRSAAATLASEDGFVVGLDLVKDERRLRAAYDDAAGVTAAFNRNILHVVNERLGGDFVPEAFAHVAFYDPERQWIEMRLRARRAMRVRVERADLVLSLAAGDEIRTELSCKYTRESFSVRLRSTGLRLVRWMTDPDHLFACALLRKK